MRLIASFWRLIGSFWGCHSFWWPYLEVEYNLNALNTWAHSRHQIIDCRISWSCFVRPLRIDSRIKSSIVLWDGKRIERTLTRVERTIHVIIVVVLGGWLVVFGGWWKVVFWDGWVGSVGVVGRGEGVVHPLAGRVTVRVKCRFGLDALGGDFSSVKQKEQSYLRPLLN